MIFYEYQCPCCGLTFEKCYKKLPKKKPPSSVICKCGIRAGRIPSRINTDLVNNTRWSNSMGVSPRQIQEAMKRYPDSVYNEKGQLRIDSRNDKKKKMKERNLVELD